MLEPNEQDVPESKSSRDIILSRYQNVKHLLVSKNKLLPSTLPPKPIEKISSPIKNSSQSDPLSESDSTLQNLISLCTQIQKKIKEKTVPQESSVYKALEKPLTTLKYLDFDLKRFKTLHKPLVSAYEAEKTVILDFKCFSKPLTSTLYWEVCTKVFRVHHKVYQIIEFKEEIKNPETVVKKILKDSIVQASEPESNLFLVPESNYASNRPPMAINSSPTISKKVNFNQNYDYKPPTDSYSKKSTSPFMPYTDTSYLANESLLDQSVSNTKSFTANESFLSYDQFMNNEKSLKNNYTFIANTQKINKQAQLLQFKQKAKEKELLMIKRKKSVMKIQALYRGWKQRKKFAPVWERHKRKQKLEKLRIIAARIKTLFAPYVILKALKSWSEYRRQEKLKLLNLFQQYSAVYIQKTWRGYKVRALYYSKLKIRNWAKIKIRALVKGWKIRKIINCKAIQNLKTGLKDLIILKNEFNQSSQSNSLLLQVSSQMPIMKEKLIKEIYKLYRTGNWTKKPKGNSNHNSVYDSIYINDSLTTSKLSPIMSREEVPVKPLQVNIDDLEILEIEAPKKTFTNFLRRGQNTKYNPKAVPAKPKPPPEETTLEAEKETSEVIEPKTTVRPLKEVRYAKTQESEENDEIPSEPDSKDLSKPVHNFLKRKSQTYKPAKVEWKAKTRVNCWGESINPEPKKKAAKKPQTSQISFIRVQELENIFFQLSRKYVSVKAHFGVNARTNTDSQIPQFLPTSLFVTHFTDDMYQETFEALQARYLCLCNEEVLP
jgi:IQ calmodulin-binding motif